MKNRRQTTVEFPILQTSGYSAFRGSFFRASVIKNRSEAEGSYMDISKLVSKAQTISENLRQVFPIFGTKLFNKIIPTVAVLAALQMSSCATGEKSTSGDSTQGFDEANIRASAGGRGGVFVHSVSNNSMTSLTVKKSKASSLIAKITRGLPSRRGERTTKSGASSRVSDAKLKSSLSALISANRLGGRSFSKVLSLARRYADIELKEGVANEVPKTITLELALTALQNKDFAMFDFLITPLLKVKNRKIEAAANNALGVMTLAEGRVPEAIQYFNAALKAVGDYEAAMLNLGFVALQFGDISTANKMLGRVSGDWFVNTGKLVAARQSGNKSEVERLCDELSKKSHKPTVFNCGLNVWIANKDGKAAKILINKALKMRGGTPDWDQRGYKILKAIRAG